MGGVCISAAAGLVSCARASETWESSPAGEPRARTLRKLTGLPRYTPQAPLRPLSPGPPQLASYIGRCRGLRPITDHSDGLDSSRKGVGPDLSRAPCSDDRDRFSPKQGPPQRCTACSCRKYGFPRLGLPGACFLQTSQHTQTCPQFTARGRASFWRHEGSQDLNRAAKVGPFASYASGRQVPPFTLP